MLRRGTHAHSTYFGCRQIYSSQMMVSLSSRRSSSLSFVSLQTQDKRKNRVYSALLLCGTSCSFRVSVSLAVVAKRRVNVVSASGCAMRAFRFGAFAAHERHDACVINPIFLGDMGKRNRMRSRKDMRAKKWNPVRGEARAALLGPKRRGATDGREKKRKRGVAQKGGGDGWWWW